MTLQWSQITCFSIINNTTNLIRRYLLSVGADVDSATQTGDTALTYACENGHTDVADLLLRAGSSLEHESEGGRTPLMKACRAGHLCTVQFLVGKVIRVLFEWYYYIIVEL